MKIDMNDDEFKLMRDIDNLQYCINRAQIMVSTMMLELIQKQELYKQLKGRLNESHGETKNDNKENTRNRKGHL